jgi:hypothetical protein
VNWTLIVPLAGASGAVFKCVKNAKVEAKAQKGRKMSYSIPDNYSVFNRYEYEGKNCAIKFLDNLSLPWCAIFGGRYVSLNSNYANKLDLSARIMVLVISIILVPIAIISGVCLLLKLITFPCVWEKKRMKQAYAKTEALIMQFKQYTAQNQSDKAIQLIKDHRGLINNPEVKPMFLEILDNNLKDGINWAGLQNQVALLRPESASNFVFLAIKRRLDKVANDQAVIDPNAFKSC